MTVLVSQHNRHPVRIPTEEIPPFVLVSGNGVLPEGIGVTEQSGRRGDRGTPRQWYWIRICRHVREGYSKVPVKR